MIVPHGDVGKNPRKGDAIVLRGGDVSYVVERPTAGCDWRGVEARRRENFPTGGSNERKQYVPDGAWEDLCAVAEIVSREDPNPPAIIPMCSRGDPDETKHRFENNQCVRCGRKKIS